jgi:hypothetical protein
LAALAIIELVPAYGGINYCFNNNLTTDTNLYSQYPQFEPGGSPTHADPPRLGRLADESGLGACLAKIGSGSPW